MFFRRRNSASEAARDAKVAESQHLLLSAAVETSIIAQDVTRTMQRRMEDAVRQFVMTARIMNDALLVCEPTGAITAFNPAAQKMFSLPDEPNLTAASLFSRRDGTMVSVDELWKIGASKQRNLTGLKLDGTRFTTNIRVAILERSDGTSVVLLVAQDTSFIEQSFGSSKHGYAIVTNNEIVAVNDSITRIFGYDQEELLGRAARMLTGSKDRAGKHLDLTFEIATIQWDGEDAMLITAREVPAA